MNKKELENKVQQLRELKAFAADLEAEISAIEDELKAEMRAADTDELTAGVFKVRWKIVTSNRFDGAALKRAMPDVYTAFTKKTECRRFSVA